MSRFALAAAMMIALATPAAATPSAFVEVLTAKSIGSAFHIGGGRFLTAAHVLAGQTAISLVADDGTRRTATVLWVDKAYDVAMIKADPAWTPGAPMPCADAPTGTAVVAHGHPLGIDDVEFRGYVAGKARDALGGRIQPFDMTLLPGNSGGAITDERGNVVGLAVSVTTVQTSNPEVSSFSGLGWAVPAGTLCDLITEHSEAKG